MDAFKKSDITVLGIVLGDGRYVPAFWETQNGEIQVLAFCEANPPMNLGEHVTPEIIHNATPILAFGFKNIKSLEIVQAWLNVTREIMKSKKPSAIETPEGDAQ